MKDEESQGRETITAYIGLQNEPLGDEPNISVSFDISLRVFCIAFALSKIEKERQMRDIKMDGQDDNSSTIEIKLEKDRCEEAVEEINSKKECTKEDNTENDK